ncbi:vanadium-dependent haloperoxidase [Hymenobacter terricola]|uniref:vanadium-dependent haloperoxidase n=1 Tax=Hymenobacter terricola TaxID=2819236 RepID=UPI001B308FF3|nr:vanadium-dependent haloperoxidase [Hymenobacter terricola]
MKFLQSFRPRLRLRCSGLLLLGGLLATACHNDETTSPSPNAPVYSGDVVTSWLTLQLKLALAAPGGPVAAPRRYAYTSIALYEAVVPGLAGYQSIAPQLNGLAALPAVGPQLAYYWPACANAAAAAMSRDFYPTASAASKATIDSLEAVTTASYKDQPADVLARSAAFGQQVAAAVSAWARTDGSDDATPYTPPVGAGLWVPTAPAFAPATAPNWGRCRPLVLNSDAGADQGPPTPYSTNPASAYYAQAQEVYNIGQGLTAEQRTIAVFWATNSWHNVLRQVLATQKPSLDAAAVAFAQVSIAMSDAQVSLYKSKYLYNAVRPITYIRTVMGQPGWNTLIPTPAHPEYPAGHSVTSGAAAEALTLVFGPNYQYTDKPYNIAGVVPRPYNSFDEAATEAGTSRVYGGMHYRKTTEVSLLQGKTIARNIAEKLKFKK